MQIIHVPISDLRPYKHNPRKNDDAVQAVAESIRQYGFLVPLVVSPDYEIVTGHTRHKAAQLLGLQEVPCVIADGLTEEQIKVFRLVDNKVGELAQWDADLLAVELADIAVDLSAFGFEAIHEDTFGEDFALAEGGKGPIQQISFTLHDKQAALLLSAIARVYADNEVTETFGNKNKNGTRIHKMTLQSSPTAPRKELGGRSFFDVTGGVHNFQKYVEAVGGIILPGFQLRYIYFIDKSRQKDLTVPVIPFSRIYELGAGMYKGEKVTKGSGEEKNCAQYE